MSDLALELHTTPVFDYHLRATEPEKEQLLKTDWFSLKPYLRAFCTLLQGSFVSSMLFVAQRFLHTRAKHHLARFLPYPCFSSEIRNHSIPFEKISS